jgi:hypothetical protein
MTSFSGRDVSRLYLIVKNPLIYYYTSVSFPQGNRSRIHTYINNLFHNFGVQAPADRLSVEHTPKPPVLVNAAPFLYARVDVQNPLEEGHDVFFSAADKMFEPVLSEKSAVPICVISHML